MVNLPTLLLDDDDDEEEEEEESVSEEAKIAMTSQFISITSDKSNCRHD